MFGRDDLPATAAEAVRASCAVPVLFEPVTVDGKRYIDGGLHSYTNVDLMGPPAFDLVVVSSPMSGTAGWSAGSAAPCRRLGPAPGPASDWASPNRPVPRPTIKPGGRRRWDWRGTTAGPCGRRGGRWVDDKLNEELEGLRRRGIAVLVVEPDADGVELVDTGSGEDVDRTGHGSEEADHSDPMWVWRAEMAAAADQAVRRIVRDRDNWRAAGLLRRAAG